MKPLFLLSATAMLCAAPATAQSGRQWDAAAYYASLIPSIVADGRVIARTPLFDNAPFLRLKKGDQLVEGRRWNPSFKGVAGRFETDLTVFLRSHGQLFDLSTSQKDGRLDLTDAELSIYFDWPVSAPSARQLWMLSGLSSNNISPERYKTIKTAVRAQFPAVVRDSSMPQIAAPTLNGPATARRAVFEGLRYESHGRELVKYRLEIGPGIYRVTERFLIVGPPEIERAEFDGAARTGLASLPNSPSFGPLDETKRAAYAQMRAFDLLMKNLLAREGLKN